MKRMIGYFLLLTLCGCTQKDNKNTDSKYLHHKTQPIIESFFSDIKSGDYKSSLHNLLSKNRNIFDSPQGVR
jgi:hypothetical protein